MVGLVGAFSAGGWREHAFFAAIKQPMAMVGADREPGFLKGAEGISHLV
jgi:hypothetical protein